MHYSELIQCLSNNNQNSLYNTQHDYRYLKVHLQLQFLTQPFIDVIRTFLTSLGSQKLMTYLSTSEVFFLLQVSQDSLMNVRQQNPRTSLQVICGHLCRNCQEIGTNETLLNNVVIKYRH